MLPNANPQALEALGWASFQDLAVAYAEDVLGADLIVFAKSRDGGVDARQSLFTAASSTTGGLLVQAKHTSTRSPLTVSSFATEAQKMPGLRGQGFTGYLLVTNHTLSAETARQIESQARSAGFTRFEVHGRDQLERRIRESATLRAMVPRLYGIGDLSQILDERVIDQTAVLLAATKSDLERFVATDAYRQSVRALDTEGVIVLLGAPAAGKSTIAKALSAASLDVWGATPLMLPSLDQLANHWNPREPARLFWIDDVFGATQVHANTVDAFNRLTPILNAALAQGCRFVLTSRTYIWKGVASQLKLSATPQLNRAIIEITVENYSARDRSQILYNHIKQGDHPQDWRQRFKPFARMVAAHPLFSPEVARRLGLSAFSETLTLDHRSITTFISNPAEYLDEVIGGLPSAGQAALAHILMSGGSLRADGDDAQRNLVCNAYGVTPSALLHELAAMEGAFCVRAVQDGEQVWRYRHPTIGEAVATVAARSPALLDVYLRGASPARILEEVVCAGVEARGAILKVGVSRYDAVISRLKEPVARTDTPRLRWFLLTKATPEFRRRFLGCPVGFGSALFDLDWRHRGQSLALLALLRTESMLTQDGLDQARSKIRDGLLKHGVADYLSDWGQTLLGKEDFGDCVSQIVSSLEAGGSEYLDFWTPSGDERRQSPPSDAFHGLTEFVERLETYIDPEEAQALLAGLELEIATRAQVIQNELDDEDYWALEEEAHYHRTHPEPVRTSGPRTSRVFADPFRDENADASYDIFSDIDE